MAAVRPIKTLLNSLYALVSTPDEARALLQEALDSDLEANWGNVEAKYKRVCINCFQPYVADRTNAAKDGFCPKCDTDINRKELQRINKQLRRAKRSNAPATLTFREWMKTLQDFDNRCAYCRKVAFKDMEHYLPIRSGGGTTADNCVPACGGCNWAKKDRNPNSNRKISIPIERMLHVKVYLQGRKGK